MNNELLIKTCQRLPKLPGRNCYPWALLWNDYIDPFICKVGSAEYMEKINRCNQAGYLTTGHFDEWSSAKILARAGYFVCWDKGGVYKLCKNLSSKGTYWLLGVHSQDMQEVAGMVGVARLHKEDRLAYDKGMAPLLKSQGLDE